MSLQQLKKKALAEVDRRTEDLTRLCSDIIGIPSENPPGDTTEVSKFVEEYLKRIGLNVRTYSPKKGLVNLVSDQGAATKPSLILNGHFDVFPAGDQGWKMPPFSGEIKDGKIFGRGATDMKAGVTASLFAYSVISQLDVRLAGKLILALVADEESGGGWGTEWLLNNVPEISGDACLIGEPGGIDSVVFGEKGRCQFRVKTTGVAGHSPMPIHTENAIDKMANVIPAVNSLRELVVSTPTELTDVINQNKIFYDRTIGKGAGNVLDHLTVNVGIIRGGRNINTVPDECEVDIDVTLPPGITPEQVKKELDSKIKSIELKDVQSEFIAEYPFHRPSLYTKMTERIANLTYNNVKEVTGKTPMFFLKHWGTDGKFFRKRGVPTIIYGTSEMTAQPNEHVLIKELAIVTKVHAATILDFLFQNNS
jgi:succinyl-diaminopimelate desuccinylase